MELDLAYVVRLHNIFSKKGWSSTPGETTVYEKLCRILNVLSEEERELLMDLCERYEWYPYSHYGTLIIKLFQELVAQGHKAPTRIYLAPLKKVADEEKTKSGDSLLYLLSGFIPFIPPPYNQSDLFVQISLKDIKDEKISLKDGEELFFLDDFFGSGSTFSEMWEEVSTNSSLTSSNVKVLALIAHQSGLDLLDQMGISYSVSLTHKKAITEYYEEPVRSRKIEVMKGIEKNITENKNFLFGFRQSEGLVTLIRTPNNTFPVFWMDYKTKNGVLEAPFPRFQIKKK